MRFPHDEYNTSNMLYIDKHSLNQVKYDTYTSTH